MELAQGSDLGKEAATRVGRELAPLKVELCPGLVSAAAFEDWPSSQMIL